jgi:threonine/homoserine/homoserine lactone efflux protein
MVPGVAFDIAAGLLLAVPGPTNALLAVGGAISGARAIPGLTGATLAGYFVSVATLIGLLGPLLAGRPEIATALRIACALVLARSAWTLWRGAGRAGPGTRPVDARAVFLTTLVNPKGLIFAFGLFPPLAGGAEAAQVFARFGLLCALAASAWVLLGATIGRRAAGRVGPAAVDKAGSVVLAAFSVIAFAASLRT